MVQKRAEESLGGLVLSQDPTPESARHLIRAYRESEWRTTRLECLKAFSRFTDLRSFLFLIEIIRKNEDLAEQMQAISALSQRRSRSAQFFLRSYLPGAPESLKPQVAYALGQTQDDQAIPVLMREWVGAQKREDSLLIKNIVIAWGELKAFETLPKIRELLARSSGLEPDLLLAGLLALARLEREVSTAQKYESHIADDSLRLQIYRSVISQIQIRGQFKLEDYLHKIFESPAPHPVLPLELRAFDEAEVELGLSIFEPSKNPKRFLFALQGLRSGVRAKALRVWLKSVHESGVMTEELWQAVIPDLAQVLNAEIARDLGPEINGLKSGASLELQLQWLDALAPYEDLEAHAQTFLLSPDEPNAESIAIRYLNLWSEWCLVKGTDHQVAQKWIDDFKLKPAVLGRLLRACAELGIELPHFSKHWPTSFKETSLRSSILVYFEAKPEGLDLKEFLNQVLLLSQLEREVLGVRILGVMESIAQHHKSIAGMHRFTEVMNLFAGHPSPDLQIGVLKILRFQPFPLFETWTIERLKSSHLLVELNAIIALKNYPHSREASEELAPKLESAIRVIQGRALDTLCAHTTLLARRAVMEFLALNLELEEVVDKVYRSFDPEKRGGAEFVEKLNAILQVNPDHPQWEKLLTLRDRLGRSGLNEPELDAKGIAVLEEIDKRLIEVIPRFKSLDSMTQAALRAAEQPFMGEATHALPVDKAPTVLEYCKALDLILDRHLGQKILFPKIDLELHDFQTLWHRLGFGEDYPNLDRVVNALGLKGRIAPEHFPLHKAKLMCATFFNGKVLQDRFKIFDGLRAWSVIFLIFTRKLPVRDALVQLPNASDEKCLSIAKRLMALQDLRNPAAHRQTYMDLASVTAVRNEAVMLLNTVLEVLF